MGPLALNAVRYGIPLALLIAGVVVAGTSGSGVAAGALFVSAATAILLLNVLYRIGVEGAGGSAPYIRPPAGTPPIYSREAARRFFDEQALGSAECARTDYRPSCLARICCKWGCSRRSSMIGRDR